MLLSEDFVYLHLPKTGGGTIKSVLQNVLPDGYVKRGPHPYVHPGWRLIPEDAAELPVFCHVRNPWDWYVSWYCFACPTPPKPAKLWQSAFGDRPDFRTFIHRACTGKLDHDRSEIADVLRGGMGFYTARWLDLVGGLDDERLYVGRFEHLFDDLEAFMRRAGAPVPVDFFARATAVDRVRIGRRGPYQDYYDDDTRELVARSSQLFLERFGYRF